VRAKRSAGHPADTAGGDGDSSSSTRESGASKRGTSVELQKRTDAGDQSKGGRREGIDGACDGTGGAGGAGVSRSIDVVADMQKRVESM
jgi:hypothetical protein